MHLTDWDHNAWYHPLLMRQVPDGPERALDVGCGAGTLARRLAARVAQVDAFDASAVMVAAATSGAPNNLAVHQADALTVVLPTGGYDAVLSSAALHHLPLDAALPRMASRLRPGGVLAVVAVRRRGDLPRELAAVTTPGGRHWTRPSGRAPWGDQRTCSAGSGAGSSAP